MNCTRLLVVCPSGAAENSVVAIAVAGIERTASARIQVVRDLSVDQDGVLTHVVGETREGLSNRMLKRATIITVAPEHARSVLKRLRVRGVAITTRMTVEPLAVFG